MSSARCLAAVALVLTLTLAAPRPAGAYSVLSHESVVDASWEPLLVPLLRQKYSGLSAEDLKRARAYAYGGSLIQDLGYFPFGSRFFSNLAHYVRSGDFVEALLSNAQDVNEYAFALGALAHYASDNAGHPIAVNRALPILYPKERAKFGDEVIYAQSPARHVMVEFAFDVTQVARGAYNAQAYHDLIGFEVAKPVLERAFRDTYGLELKSVFFDEDLAIGTFRYAVSNTIPEMTRLAWRDKKDEIVAQNPGIQESAFVFSLSRAQYEQSYGTKYRKPGFFSRVLMLVLKVVPKIGPFRPLAFEPLTPETEKLFLDSVAAARARYRQLLDSVRAGTLAAADTDLDTGDVPPRGRNTLAEETYLQLLQALEKDKFATVPPQLRADINAHFHGQLVQGQHTTPKADRDAEKDERKARKLLARLNGTPTAAQSRQTN